MKCIDCCRLIPFLKIEAQLIYNVVSVTAVLQSDSEIYIYTHTHTFFFKILFSVMAYHGILNIVPCAPCVV